MVVISSQTDIDNLVNELIQSETTVLEGDLTIEGFNVNPDFSGLNNNLRTINGNYIITNNSFTEFELNEYITTVTGSIEITNNPLLKTISNFTSLTTLGGGFTISNNPLINFLPDIPYLTVVNGDFTISYMEGILYIISNFCSYLYSINGYLTITNNANLMHIDGFTHTTTENPFFYIQEYLVIRDNPYLIDIIGFNGISPAQKLHISDNPNFCKAEFVNTTPVLRANFVHGGVTCTTQSQLDQLSNIRIITGDLTIYGFTPDFSKLSNLEEIGGTLIITNNVINTDFNHFNNLKIICRDLYIINNTGLSGILGFFDLITIGGNIYIRNNDLSSISGFNNVTNVYNIRSVNINDVTNYITFNDSYIASGVSNVRIDNLTVAGINTIQITLPTNKKHQTISNYKTAEDVISRRVILKSWNTANAMGVINNHARVTSPFPSVYNRTDFLSRKECNCDIPNPLQESRHILKSNMGSIIKSCDGTGVPCANTNVKYVPDSSLYTRYKREVMANQNFNA